jgi:ATP-dependent RNA helicase DeaD
MAAPAPIQNFSDLGLPEPLLQVVREVGYETPSPIQAESIPVLLAGHDLLGQAQTGTGKTAAFALPLLARADLESSHTQILVLAPTRELALQVAEACQTYARHLPNFHVLPIYGGQAYGIQLRQLRRGAQVVVGTPGRVMDHMRRGALRLDRLQALVLDEADEMLRMGFIDDVEWILEHTPPQRQIALFSATMPAEIRKVADRHLRDPHTIRIQAKTATAATIRQRYWTVGGLHKLDALTRLLETEEMDGAIIFVRTKTATEELAEKLAARGYACAPLNGDIPQAQREKTVERLRQGGIDLLIATDVAARGLDVQRISHVINYDIPYDTESYVHRIGRTGRAGRAGQAILFVAPREHRMLRAIEKAIRQPIEPMQMPTVADINVSRMARFKQRIAETLADDAGLAPFYRLVSEYEQEFDEDPLRIAAALARLVQGTEPLLLAETKPETRPARPERAARGQGPARPERGPAAEQPERKTPRKAAPERHARPLKDFPEIAMERFRIAVGYQHGVKPANIVGAIANEADLESRYIGHIEIYDDFSTVDLPAGMPPETFNKLKHTWVCQQKLAIERLADLGKGIDEQPRQPTPGRPKPDKPKKAPRAEGRGPKKGPRAEGRGPRKKPDGS